MNDTILELQSILNSKALADILREHKNFLQKEVNRYVREQNLFEAYGALSKLGDYDRIFKLINKRIEDIKKGGNDGNR